MNYTLNQLRIFFKICETQSVTRAAEELHLTQPAVSIQLKNFQDQFDIPLTEVVGRKIFITDFGKEIAETAKNILEQVSAIDYKTHAYKGQLIGKLKISIVSTGKYIMPYFLSDFINLNPGVELQMDVTNKEKVVSSIENNEVDFSLVSIIPEKLNVDKIDLLPNKLYLMGGSTEKLNNKSSVKDLFKSESFIYREKGSGTRQMMERFLSKNNISTLKKLELTSNEAVKQALIAGLGYSLVPLIGVRNEILNNELYIIPNKNLPLVTTWSLVWVKGKKHSPVAKAFLNFLNEEKENIIKEKFNWYNSYL